MQKRYRFRKLHAHDDRHAMAALEAARRREALRSLDLDGALGAHGHDAPRRIEATEAEASHDDLVAALTAGELSPNDLVWCDGAWSTFEHAPDFHDACAPLLHRRRWLARAGTGLAVLLVGVAGAACLLWSIADAVLRSR